MNRRSRGRVKFGFTAWTRGKATRASLATLLILAVRFPIVFAAPFPLELRGTSVIPHSQSTTLRYRREPDRSLGARVQLFLLNEGATSLSLPAATPLTLRGKTPDELLAGDEWAWHDFPSAYTNATLDLPPGALTVWSFNGKRTNWGTGTMADLTVAGTTKEFAITTPGAWLSAITFLGEGTNLRPNRVVFQVANRTELSLRLRSLRFWLPATNSSWRALFPQPWLTNLASFSADGVIPAGDSGGARVITGPLPLTYAALELRLETGAGETVTLWAHLRIKRESFDLGGGWLNSNVAGRSTLTCEPFLQTLRRMHINTGMHEAVPGYTDNPGLYSRYPLKYMNRCQPLSEYDTAEVLPRIHAVEFLGEPQYGGGRPVAPMAVWRALAPYQATRLPTSVTHSEERIWREYAGLSDFPHFDAYRVIAPAADAWSKYDRWDGRTLRWGAPLETLGDLARSLRDLNRPVPIACWAQGPHDGWGASGGRRRAAPTPEELRVQAYEVLSSRLTSLYWFNLSLKSLVKFPDLIEPITRVNREILMLEDYYLEGDAYHYERQLRDGRPDWDLAVIAGPRGALLFALDLAYEPDPVENVFRFAPPREATLNWPVPAYLATANSLWQITADSVTPVLMECRSRRVAIRARCGPVSVFLLATDPGAAAQLEARRRELVAEENSVHFDPAHQAADLATLRTLLAPAQ